MLNKSLYLAIGLASLTSISSFANAQDMKSSHAEFAPKMSAAEHYNAGMQAIEQQNWRTALRNFTTISLFFPDSNNAEDAFYFQAVCNYHLMEYDMANKLFSDYLGQKMRLRYFEEALAYKLAIADKFKEGERKRLFDSSKMPKWVAAREDAVTIYDELASMVPTHEIAAKALFAKADFHHKNGDADEALEAYQDLIKRFPKHPLASDAYLGINEVYYGQSHTEFQNPDLLQLARLNLKRFQQNFPRDPKIEEAKKYLADIEEIHARGLYETGMFYERTKRPTASVIYYVTAVEKFPNAPSTAQCKKRLLKLHDAASELEVSTALLQP